MHPSRQARIRSLITPSLESGDVTINLNMVEDPLNEDEKAIEAASAEADMQEDDVDQLEETGVALESFYEEVKTSYDNGGMSPATARMLARGLEFHYNRIGVEHTSVSVEGFEDATTRRDVTRTSLESIGEVIGNVWQATKNAILKAIKFMMDFFASILGGFVKIKARATEALKFVNSMSDNGKTGKIKLLSTTYITHKGSVTPNDIRLAVHNTAQMCEFVFETYGPLLSKHRNEETAIIKAISLSDKIDNAKVLELKASSHDSAKEIEDKLYDIKNVRLPGGHVIDKPERGLGLEIKRLSEINGNPTQIDQDITIDVLSKSDIRAVASSIIDLATHIEAKKGVIEANKKALSEFIDVALAVEKKEGTAAYKRAFLSLVGKYAQTKNISIFNKAPSFAFKVSRSALAAVEKSIAFHQGK